MRLSNIIILQNKIDLVKEDAALLQQEEIRKFVAGTVAGDAPIIPISKSAWWKGVKAGSYPAPIKLSENVTVWRSDEIQSLVNEICNNR